MRALRPIVFMLIVACDDGLGPEVTCAEVQSTLDAACVGCHGGASPMGNLSLEAVGEAVGEWSAQAELALIEPGSPAESYLFHKVDGTHLDVGGLGDAMPPQGALSEERITALAAWIEAGAACEERPTDTGDSGDTGEPVEDGCGEVQAVLDAECTGCHGAFAVDGLDLRDVSAVLGQMSPNSGLPLIAAGDAGSSYLIDKIRGTHLTVGGEGVQMPPGKTLSDADVALLEVWIDEGASCSDPLPGVPPAEYDPNTLDQDALFVCDGLPASSPSRIRRIDKSQLRKRVGRPSGHELAANPLEAAQVARYSTYSVGATLDVATLDLHLDMLPYVGEPWQGEASWARVALEARDSEIACMYSTSATPDRSCVEAFVSKYLTTAVVLGTPDPGDVERLTSFAEDTLDDEALTGATRAESLTMITGAAWLMTNALFESEMGQGEADTYGRTRLGSDEVAAMIANMLTDRGPGATSIYLYDNDLSGDERWTDERGPHLADLADAARDGTIQDPEVASRLVRRYAMGLDPDREDEWLDYGTHSLDQRRDRSEEWMADRVDRFFIEWFDVAGFESGFQDAPNATTVWHDEDPKYYQSAVDEMRAYEGWNEPDGLMVFTDTIARIVTRDRDVLRGLLTENEWYIPANEENGGEYTHRVFGLASEVEPTRSSRWNLLPESERAGLLTHPIWLAAHGDAFEDGPSLVHRGKWVREKLFCQTVPPLELVTVAAMLSPNDDDQSARQRVEESIETQEECMGCHQYMNDLGKPFEFYNHAGLLRADDHGLPPDGSTVVANAPDPFLNGSYESPMAFVNALGESPYVKRCFIRQTFRYFAGRDERMSDACVLSAMEEAYDESGGSFVGMLEVLATHDGMIYRTTEEAP